MTNLTKIRIRTFLNYTIGISVLAIAIYFILKWTNKRFAKFMIIEKVRRLIYSDISATEIEKATGVDASSIRRIRRGERKLENLSFEKGVALYEYVEKYLKG